MIPPAPPYRWARQDSNLGPTDYESAALTAELRARRRQRSLAAGRAPRAVVAGRGGKPPVESRRFRDGALLPRRGSLKTFQHERHLRTTGGLHVTDITDDVGEVVKASGIRNGIVCVYSPHTTCSVRVNEFESGFLEDFAELLRRLVPSDGYYAHDDWDKRTENICPEDMDFGNGHAHCMSMLLGPAGESIPVRDGELCLGTWQRVLFLELDRERDRRWLVQVVGT